MSLIGEAFVRIRPDDTGFKAEATRQVKRDLSGVQQQVGSTNRELGRFERGTLAGSGALIGLGRAAAFASGAFIGGAGLAFALKSTVNAAEQQQAVQAQLVNALKQQNIALQGNVEAIDRRSLALANMSGYDDELLKTTFVNFVRRTGDVNKALKLNEIAVNVARGRNISLEASAALVTRASLGMAGALRRVGIAAEKGASATELLDLLQQKYAGSAVAYGRTAAGAQERFKVALQNTQEEIGKVVLPDITKLLTATTDWLNKASTQAAIHRDTGKAAKVAGDGFSILAAAIGAATTAWEDYNKAVEKAPGNDQTGFFKVLLTGNIVSIVKLLDTNVKGLGQDLGLVGKNSKDAAAGLETFGQAIGKAFAAQTGSSPDLFFFDSAANNGLLKGKFQIPGKPESLAQQLQRAVSLAGLTPGTADDERAIRAQNSQYQKGLDFALQQLRLRKGNLAKFSDEAKTLADEIAANESTLAGFASDRARAAKDARDKAEKARLAAIEALIPNQVRGQGIAAGAFGRFQALVAATIPGRVRGHGVADISAVAEQTAAQQAAALHTQIAEQQVTNDKKLIPFLQTEAKLAQEHLRLLKKVGASTVDQLTETLHIAELRRRIRDIGKQSSAQDAFSIQDLFGEAGNQFAAYGSNVAPLNQPLSRQESGGAAVRAAQAGGKSITVVQNFIGARDAGQAIQEASNAARALRY